MKRRALAALAATLVALLAPATAPGKGPLEASLEGPGLDAPIRVPLTYHGARDDPRRGPLEHIALATGLFALATGLFTAVFADASIDDFEAASRALRIRPPAGDLGSRYTLTYRLEGPGSEEEIVQFVYPHAEPRPLTYLAPGSWFIADPGLEDALLEVGLPGARAESGRSTIYGALAAIAIAIAAGLVSIRVR